MDRTDAVLPHRLLTGTSSAGTARSRSCPATTAQGRAPRGTVEVVASSTAVAHGGTHSLSVTGRPASWNGPAHDLLWGGEYQVLFGVFSAHRQDIFSVTLRAPADDDTRIERSCAHS